jgi:hypothetical protein
MKKEPITKIEEMPEIYGFFKNSDSIFIPFLNIVFCFELSDFKEKCKLKFLDIAWKEGYYFYGNKELDLVFLIHPITDLLSKIVGIYHYPNIYKKLADEANDIRIDEILSSKLLNLGIEKRELSEIDIHNMKLDILIEMQLNGKLL